MGDRRLVRKVIKRRGTVEEYAVEKLVTSMLKAGADLKTAREIARRIEEELAEKEEVRSEELRSRVLELLKERNREWYENWVVYDRAVKKRAT